MENNISNYRAEQQEQSFGFSDMLELILLHKWWYVLSLTICLLAAGFYLYRTPKLYSRNEKVIIDDSDQSALSKELKRGISGAAMSMVGTSKAENELQAIQSPDLMKKVVERLKLETNYIDNQVMRTRELYKGTPFELNLAGDNMASGFSFTVSKMGSGFIVKDFVVGGQDLDDVVPISGEFGDTLTTPAGRIILTKTAHFDNWKNPLTIQWRNSMTRAKSYCSHLNVALSNKMSSVATLTLTDHFPTRAESILSTLLDIYDETWIDNLNRSARNTSEFINERLVLIEQELGGIESNLRDYKTANNISDVAAATQNYLNESSQMARKSLEARNQLSVANYVKGYIGSAEHTNSLIPSGTGLEATIEAQIRDYNHTMLERDRMLAISSENNPVIRDLNSTLDAMKIAINRSIDNLISALQLQVNKYDDQERQLLSHMSSATGQQYQLLSIERQQKVKEELYVFLLQKREENEITSLLNVANTRLIQAPNGSSAPVSPSTTKIALIALLLGLGIPFGIFYMKKTLDTTVHSRKDLTNISMPFLAEIPEYGKSSKLLKGSAALNNHENNKILVKHGSRDAMNEAFRVLRTNINMMTKSKGGSNVILVTSFNPNAGKTFTSMNLASSLALNGCKVLLMDLDLRKATLSKALDKNTTGTASYLSGKSSNLSELKQQIGENLEFLSVGTLPPNPAELLDSAEFHSMMAQVRSEYDFVVVDCPPIDIVADTSLMADEADLSIFVIRAGLFDKRSIAPMEAEYASGRFKRMCLVLNGVDYSNVKSHYGYGYGSYGYGYGNESES